MATGIKNKNMVLLWTNPSPSSAFQPQTISLDLSNYNAALIAFNEDTNGSGAGCMLCLVGKSANFVTAPFGVGTNYIRKVTVTSSDVQFGQGGVGNNAYVPEANIPAAIYGIQA